MGTVYLLNATPSTALYQVNYGAPFSCRPWSDGTGSLPEYAPRQVSAQREQDIVAGQFGNGDNALYVAWPDLLPPVEPATFTVPFDSTRPGEAVQDPIVVYVLVGWVEVLDRNGTPLSPPLPTVAGNPPG